MKWCNVRSGHCLNPELTASWEKGLNYVAEGSITSREYMDKLEHFIRVKVGGVLQVKLSGGVTKPIRQYRRKYIEKEENDHEYGKYSN